MATSDNLFEAFINSLNDTLPENGLESPDSENITDDVAELDGTILKVTFDLILFMNHNKSKYYMINTNQKMQDMGKMSLKDAILKFNSKSRRKKT